MVGKGWLRQSVASGLGQLWEIRTHDADGHRAGAKALVELGE